MISQGEMAPGQIITIYSTNPTKQMIMTMEGFVETDVPADTNMLTGIPLEIKSVDLPFILCQFLVHIPRLPYQQVILDTRNFVFKEVKAEFARTYRRLYKQKKELKQLIPLGHTSGPSLMDFFSSMGQGVPMKQLPPPTGDSHSGDGQGVLFNE